MNETKKPPERIWVENQEPNPELIEEWLVCTESHSGMEEYILKSTADKDNDSLVKCNTELMQLVEELEDEIEKAQRALKPIRNVAETVKGDIEITGNEEMSEDAYANLTWKAIKETLAIADKKLDNKS